MSDYLRRVEPHEEHFSLGPDDDQYKSKNIRTFHNVSVQLRMDNVGIMNGLTLVPRRFKSKG